MDYSQIASTIGLVALALALGIVTRVAVEQLDRRQQRLHPGFARQ